MILTPTEVFSRQDNPYPEDPTYTSLGTGLWSDADDTTSSQSRVNYDGTESVITYATMPPLTLAPLTVDSIVLTIRMAVTIPDGDTLRGVELNISSGGTGPDWQGDSQYYGTFGADNDQGTPMAAAINTDGLPHTYVLPMDTSAMKYSGESLAASAEGMQADPWYLSVVPYSPSVDGEVVVTVYEVSVEVTSRPLPPPPLGFAPDRNNAHHGSKVVTYTAGPIPVQPSTLTPVVSTYASQARDMLAWNGEDAYVIETEISNYSAQPLFVTPDSNDRGGPVLALNGQYNYVSNFVQPGYVALRKQSAISSGRDQLVVLACGPTPTDPANENFTVVSTIDMPYPLFTSGQQYQRAIVVPYHGGKVFVFTANGSGAGELWSSNVSTSGVASAFTKVGNLTAPVGFLSSVGPPAGNSPANYLLESIHDMAQISDRLFWSYSTKTLWDVQNPLVLKDGGAMIPADATIYKPYDWTDPAWGASSSFMLNPGHLLVFRRDTPLTHSKMVDVLFAADGSSCSIVSTWDTPVRASPYSATWAKKGSGVEAVAALSCPDDTAQPFHLYRDLFGSASDLTPPGPSTGNPTDWTSLSNLAPTKDDGWIGVGSFSGTNYVFRQGFLEPVEIRPNALYVKGPSTAEQGDYQKHRGVFAIDGTSKTISLQVQMASPEQSVWVQPYAHFGVLDDSGEFQDLGADQVGGPLALSPGTTWTQVDLLWHARAQVTHWSLELRMFADAEMTVRLPEGTKVHYDCFYVPDNGLSLTEFEQDYLDGDQPKATWEGEKHNSTSIYGAKPPSELSQVLALDDELLLGDPPAPTPEPEPDPVTP